ncbi:MAG: UDP-N-acetylmuramoyl-tripeptide--D-alanyl-D-alanine ligase [Clostridia bacterium]|nr:UDP-N-acetylmuramoyl-tripeptide--D-alanyl-D-alanine ligase [Clostridia bacterium]
MKVNVGGNGLTMPELADICGGVLCNVGGDAVQTQPFRFVCTDSREAAKETLFVALGGERVDGHDYIGAAVSSGNECVLCERIPENIGQKYTAVVVEDSLRAVGELAKAYDRRMSHRKVAITGSVGKTTTKEFVASVLAEGFRRVHKTEGNYNSTLGMPLSLLSLQHDTEASVLEMGMSGFGEIEYMSRIAEPDIAIVTNIGSSHMEYLGSRENICRAKMEIVSGLKRGGTLLLNGDEPLLRNYPHDVEPIYVGFSEGCHIRAVNLREGFGRMLFDLCDGDRVLSDVEIPTMGRHNVYAALFAYAVGARMNLSDEAILAGLRNYRPIGMRQNIYKIGSISVIEDCYNASPESMRAAVGVLKTLAAQNGGRMAAVLGDMYELGEGSARFHEEIGLFYAREGGSLLYTFGENAEQIAGGAILGGMAPECIYRNTSVASPALTGEMLLHSLMAGDTLLVKASRGARAERILEYLKENEMRLPS